MVSFRVLESIRVKSETKTESLTSESDTKTETKAKSVSRPVSRPRPILRPPTLHNTVSYFAPLHMQKQNVLQDGNCLRRVEFDQLLKNHSDRILHNQTKEIQMDLTRFALTSEPKVQITQKKNPVKDNVHIFHISKF